MKGKQVNLKTRWCASTDILQGWVVIHSAVTHELGLKHLNHIKLKCVDTGKTTYCRIYGPGSKTYQGYDQATIQSSIYLDAHYQQKLGIEDMSGSTLYTFEISKASMWIYSFLAANHHPNDGVKIGAILGLISLGLGALSLILGLFSLCL